jgi:guanylate kinase
LSGASGVGKTTLLNLISHRYPVIWLRNFVTRGRRTNEGDDQYIFGSEAILSELLKENEMLAYHHWEANGHKYGLLKSEVEKQVETCLVYQTTWLGWALKSQNPSLVTNIWLTLADEDEILRRMRTRSTESETEILRRFNQTVTEQRLVLSQAENLITSGKVDHFVEVIGKSTEDLLMEIIDLNTRQDCLVL